jgi:hypothetical protein
VSSRMTLKRLIDNQSFPPGFLITPNARAWIEDEVLQWIANRPAARKLAHKSLICILAVLSLSLVPLRHEIIRRPIADAPQANYGLSSQPANDDFGREAPQYTWHRRREAA